MSGDIFNYYSVIEEANPKLRGFIKFTKRSLSLHNFYVFIELDFLPEKLSINMDGIFKYITSIIFIIIIIIQFTLVFINKICYCCR